MKLFVGIQLDHSIKTQLSHVQASLKTMGYQGRYTPYDNFHLTLVFIGDVINHQLEKIEEACSKIEFEPFELTLGQLDCFSKRNGDIWWCSIKPSKELHKLQRQIVSNLIEHEVTFDVKPFRPHITLVRQFKAREDIPLVLPYIEKATIQVDAFHLMQSVRIKDMLRYPTIMTFDHDGEAD